MNGKHITEGNNPARICEKGHELHTFIIPEEDSVLYVTWNGLICKPENCPFSTIRRILSIRNN